MSKLPSQHKFFDLSDYGRGIAIRIATVLKDTSVTPVDVTWWFVVSGILAIACMLYQQPLLAAFFLVLKSILDAADGELSRLKNTPSYVGRYFDSIADIILNFLFVLTIWYISANAWWTMILAFVAIQLQGTLYNYYYVILRTTVSGDTTSRVFEDSAPSAMPGENQSRVDIYFSVFRALYGVFDRSVILLDPKATSCRPFPKWFMTINSSMGLGFQLLIMGAMLALGLTNYILPFFISYTLVMALFIVIRRTFLR